jgi:hypothetical protein
MCTPRRKSPFVYREMDIASSRSFASSPSIVMVVHPLKSFRDFVPRSISSNPKSSSRRSGIFSGAHSSDTSKIFGGV